MPIITAIRPTAKVTLPHQSILAGLRSERSRSLAKPQTVPRIPNGTETRNTARQATGASTPPRTRPMDEPATAATPLIPRARPRWLAGKASVMIALELANSIAPPTPCSARMMISHIAPELPFIQVTASMIEKKVKTAKPRLNVRARP